MNPLAVTDDLEVPALFVRRLGEPPRPREGHTDYPSIHEMGRDRLVGNLYVLDAWLHDGVD